MRDYTGRMRWLPILLTMFVLSSCVGAPKNQRRAPPVRHGQTRTPQPRVPVVPADDPRELRQCLFDLDTAGIKYNRLPDRVFGGGCSATGAVQLVSVGIPIANLGAIKCRTAERLSAWTNEAVQSAALAWMGARVVKIESFGTYNCRPRNGVEDAKLSEHGRANAVDIAAFQFDDGRRVTVKQGWRGGDDSERNFLRAVFKAACRRFWIVIGPDGDTHHQDHFHFDMGAGGPYCH